MKGVGLNLDDALAFWRHEFSHKVMMVLALALTYVMHYSVSLHSLFDYWDGKYKLVFLGNLWES